MDDPPSGGERWFAFESVRVLSGGGPEVLLVPLPGHTLGHTAVAVARYEGWLLHCGDFFFHHGEIETPRRCPAGLRAFQTLMQGDGKVRPRQSGASARARPRRTAGRPLICSHDETQLERARPAP